MGDIESNKLLILRITDRVVVGACIVLNACTAKEP